MPVDEEDRRPGATVSDPHGHFSDGDPFIDEALEHAPIVARGPPGTEVGPRVLA